MARCPAGTAGVGGYSTTVRPSLGSPGGRGRSSGRLSPRPAATAAARAVLAEAGKAGIDQVLALTDLGNVASQRVAERLGMRDEGVTERWFGLTTRQYRLVIG